LYHYTRFGQEIKNDFIEIYIPGRWSFLIEIMDQYILKNSPVTATSAIPAMFLDSQTKVSNLCERYLFRTMIDGRVAQGDKPGIG